MQVRHDRARHDLPRIVDSDSQSGVPVRAGMSGTVPALDGIPAMHMHPDHIHEVSIVVKQSPQGFHVVLIPGHRKAIPNVARHLDHVHRALQSVVELVRLSPLAATRRIEKLYSALGGPS